MKPGQRERKPSYSGSHSNQPLSFKHCLDYQIIYYFNDYKHNLCFFAKKLTQKNLTFSLFLSFQSIKQRIFKRLIMKVELFKVLDSSL